MAQVFPAEAPHIRSREGRAEHQEVKLAAVDWHRYASVDLETKRAAISKAKPIDTKAGAPRSPAWQRDQSILAWLEAL